MTKAKIGDQTAAMMITNARAIIGITYTRAASLEL
jgi:hypothetical protein